VYPKRSYLRKLALCVAAVLACTAVAAGEKNGKVVIPFDLVSKFDDGRYGQMVAESIWKKIERAGQFVIPESPQDVRETCSSNGVKIGPQTPLAQVEEVVRGTFDAQIGIWGSVERTAGTEAEIYDLVLKCVDFSTPGEPKVIYEKTGVRTNSVSEIPHLYVKEMLDKLYERAAPAPRGVDPVAEERWESGKNLVIGDFEQATRGVPKGWEARGGQQREPLGNLVKWLGEAGNLKNHVIRFTIPKAVAEAEGVMYYSDFFPVEEHATYRFQCRWRSNGPSPKVFIKCYDEMPSEYRAVQGRSAGGDSASGSQYQSSLDRREVYRSQQNLYGQNNQWNVHTQDFTPKHTKYSPKWGKIMLYGYLKEGVVEFDDIVLKQIAPPPANLVKGETRHSQASKVTMKEMEENERRGQAAREDLRQDNQTQVKKPAKSEDGPEEQSNKMKSE